LLKCPDYNNPKYEGKYTDLPKKIQQLRQPAYNRPLQIGEHSKELGQIGKIIATFPGLGKKAGEIEKMMGDFGLDLKHASDLVMGSNKDGSMRKVVNDMMIFLNDLKQKLGG